MSDDRIDDDELNMTADSKNRLGGETYTEQVSVGPVRGGGALKGIFAKENRKRLFLYLVAVLLVFGSVIYAYQRFPKEEALKGGSGQVKSNPLQTEKNFTPSAAQKQEAERYNETQLPVIQQEDPYAHPVVVTESDGSNPFHQQKELSRPGKLSEVGSSTEKGSSSTADRRASNTQQAASTKDVDDLIKGLIEAEGSKSPEAYSVDWSYKKPRSMKVASSESSANATSQGLAQSSGSMKCKNPATRAASEYLATADMALNSDVGGPVSLTIRNGKLQGMQIIGAFERKEEWLRMELKKLVTSDETVPVDAIGLDIETTLNAVEGEVDNHTLYRYGWWGFGSALKALGKAAQMNADQNIVISNGTALQTTKADTSRELKIALGSLGEDLGDVMRDRLKRPPTVSLKVGDEVGIFFLDDVCLTAKPKGY